jgi:hypothetical protein
MTKAIQDDGGHGEHEKAPATCQLWEMQTQSVPIPVPPHMKHSESLIWAGSLGFVVSIEVSTAVHAPDPTPGAHGGRTRGEPGAASPESIDASPALVAASGAVEQDQMPSIIRQAPSISGGDVVPELSAATVLPPQPAAAATRTHVRPSTNRILAAARPSVS